MGMRYYYTQPESCAHALFFMDCRDFLSLIAHFQPLRIHASRSFAQLPIFVASRKTTSLTRCNMKLACREWCHAQTLFIDTLKLSGVSRKRFNLFGFPHIQICPVMFKVSTLRFLHGNRQ
jgi:hypothetical protein